MLRNPEAETDHLSCFLELLTLSVKHLGKQDWSVVRVPGSRLKGHGFESQQEWQENFLLQGHLSVQTLISVSVGNPAATLMAFFIQFLL